ncbi:MAG: DUF87 domain-containing protein [archaeon]
MHEIIIGRSQDDLEKFGTKGTGIIGKHFVGKKGDQHLTTFVRIDLARPHIIGLFGKRGQGKSYSMGSIAEEIANQPDDIRMNMAALIIDTMGIYWSMKEPNERDFQLLASWHSKPKGFPIDVLIPEGLVSLFNENKIPYDGTYSFKPSELDIGSWALTFNIDLDTEMGLLLSKVIKMMNEDKKDFSLEDIIEKIGEQNVDHVAKEALINRFIVAESWGIFNPKGTSIFDIIKPGKICVIDVSQFGLSSGGWSVNSLVVGLLARKILEERMKARRQEELDDMGGTKKSQHMPITWMLIDEAHQFLPREGMTPSSGPLLQWVKIGREPGVSLVLATQMPNKLHQEAISQCDLVISHRLTSSDDINALASTMQTYQKYGIADYYDALPRVKGAALVLDDNSERIIQLRMRPRMSWHAGGSPGAIKD